MYSCAWATPELACKRQPWACYALYDTSGFDTAPVYGTKTMTSLKVQEPDQLQLIVPILYVPSGR